MRDARGCPYVPDLAAHLDVTVCSVLQYIATMDADKTVAMSFRVTPTTKRLLTAAAEQERRSLTNMVEVLVEDFCRRNGILGMSENRPNQGMKRGDGASE